MTNFKTWGLAGVRAKPGLEEPHPFECPFVMAVLCSYYSLRSKTISPIRKPSHLLEMLVVVDCGTKATQRWLTRRVFDYIDEHKTKTSKLKNYIEENKKNNG
jgi:hypothetical protein